MLTCRELINDFLMEYVAGELPTPQGLRFRFHLLFCSACRRYLRSYRDTVSLGRDASMERAGMMSSDVPEELVQAILASRGQGQ